MEYKTLGSSLSLADYNAYVSLLKYNTSLAETFEINSSTVKGVYADYEFNFENATIVNDGLLVTDESKASTNTIELKNPIFKNSNYILSFKVMSIEDYNLCNEGTDNISYTDFQVVLTNDEKVAALDLSGYENGLVILFNVEVLIKHNIEIKELV